MDFEVHELIKPPPPQKVPRLDQAEMATPLPLSFSTSDLIGRGAGDEVMYALFGSSSAGIATIMTDTVWVFRETRELSVILTDGMYALGVSDSVDRKQLDKRDVGHWFGEAEKNYYLMPVRWLVTSQAQLETIMRNYMTWCDLVPDRPREGASWQVECAIRTNREAFINVCAPMFIDPPTPPAESVYMGIDSELAELGVKI